MENLYSSRFSGISDDMAVYLSTVSLPLLSNSSRQFLEQPITCSKLEEALRLLPYEKSPGSDGRPMEFLKSFKDDLLPPLLEVFQEALKWGDYLLHERDNYCSPP